LKVHSLNLSFHWFQCYKWGCILTEYFSIHSCKKNTLYKCSTLHNEMSTVTKYQPFPVSMMHVLRYTMDSCTPRSCYMYIHQLPRFIVTHLVPR
jgi:hypothetical protein